MDEDNTMDSGDNIQAFDYKQNKICIEEDDTMDSDENIKAFNEDDTNINLND
jgi:hypothetical protein